MNNLKLYRLSLGLTGKQMADILLFEEYKIYKIERNEIKNEYFKKYKESLHLKNKEVFTKNKILKSKVILRLNNIKSDKKYMFKKIFVDTKQKAVILKAILLINNINVSIKKNKYYIIDTTAREVSRFTYKRKKYEEMKL